MRKTLLLLFLSLFIIPVFSQEAEKEKEKEKEKKVSRPVRNIFGTSLLIDNQTVVTPFKGSLVLEIHHRFSTIENYHNLFGIYGAANTRMGLNYGISGRFMIGGGTTKDFKLQDIQWKYQILQQTEDNTIPVSVAYYGNMVADLRKDDAFGPEDRYRDIHRLSYFTQFIVARKISPTFSVQLAPSMAYFNSVPRYEDGSGNKNLNFGISAGARANFFGQQSLIVEYDQLLTRQDLDTQPKPNLSLGWEIGTATHTFQIFVANYSYIISQRNLVFNTNDFAKGDFLVGFNITVRF